MLVLHIAYRQATYGASRQQSYSFAFKNELLDHLRHPIPSEAARVAPYARASYWASIGLLLIMAGYRYALSILQAEFALTQVLDRPVTGRIFFEQVIRENLDIGR